MIQKSKPRVGPHATDQEVLAKSLATLSLYRRDSFLEAVALIATELLHTPDLQQSLPQVVERIGRAIDVDRVHLFEVDTAASLSRQGRGGGS